MRVLDLYCGAGGAAMGYHRVGFEVVGVDINPQPNYPFEFIQADVLDMTSVGEFSLIHASPPCQAYSLAQRLQGRQHPDLIPPTRKILVASGLPYVIENVPRSPLKNPVELCGSMFGLGTYRHRLFETSFPLWRPTHPEHSIPTTKMGRSPRDGEMMHVVGNFSGVANAREAMDIDWMTRDELREAVPPAYTEYVGSVFVQQVA